MNIYKKEVKLYVVNFGFIQTFKQTIAFIFFLRWSGEFHICDNKVLKLFIVEKVNILN